MSQRRHGWPKVYHAGLLPKRGGLWVYAPPQAIPAEANGRTVYELHPAVLPLTPDAFELWRKFHDDVVRELAAEGELADVCDLAAAVLNTQAQPFTVSDARRALGTTRRVAVPLLEQLDARRITRRGDDSTRTVV